MLFSFIRSLGVLTITLFALMACGGGDESLTRPSVAVVPLSSANSSNVHGGFATFSLEIGVVAVGGDVYISSNPAESFSYQMEDGQSKPLGIGRTSATIGSQATFHNGYYRIAKGQIEVFTLTVVYRPEVSGTVARMRLLELKYNDTPKAPVLNWVPSNNEFKTASAAV